jgi:phosphatidylserine/phosphatidylglycerophosphate/cardiolipin synthase-like enzyme
LKTELVEIKQKNTEIIFDSNELYTLVNSIEVELTTARSKIDFAVENSSHLSGIYNWIDTLSSNLADLNNFKLGMDNKIVEVVDTIVSDKNIEQSINQSISKQFEVIKRILPKQYSYDLVCGRSESRNIFIDALKQSKKSLFLVCPWITNYAINSTIKQQIESALRRGVSINVGWGHLNDVENNISQLSKNGLLKSVKARKWDGYSAVDWLYDLHNKYPNLMTIKILGTHEKFLVCDEKFAMLGSHNFMSSGSSSNERELGMKTNSIEFIHDLIELYNNNM